MISIIIRLAIPSFRTLYVEKVYRFFFMEQDHARIHNINSEQLDKGIAASILFYAAIHLVRMAGFLDLALR